METVNRDDNFRCDELISEYIHYGDKQKVNDSMRGFNEMGMYVRYYFLMGKNIF